MRRPRANGLVLGYIAVVVTASLLIQVGYWILF